MWMIFFGDVGSETGEEQNVVFNGFKISRDHKTLAT